MFLPRREDSAIIDRKSPMRQVMPFLMKRRNESVVYFEQDICVDRALDYLREENAKSPIERITFFHLVLSSINRVLAQKTRLNRYILGNKTYQRKNCSISFAVKPSLNEDCDIRPVKVEIEHSDELSTVAKKVEKVITEGRKSTLNLAEKEMKVLSYLPGFMVKSVIGIRNTLDNVNLLPKSMIREDPLYASVFVANMASIGMEAPFHHLYEYGGVSLFVGFGRVKKVPMVERDGTIAVKKVVTFRFSFDERVVDGFYCAKALKLFKRLIENPTRGSSA